MTGIAVRRSSLDDLLDVLGLDLGTARGERLHESGVRDDAEGAQGAAGSLVQEGESVLGEYRVLSAAGTHAGVDEGKRFVGGEGVDGEGDGDGTGERLEHGQAELAGEIFRTAEDDGESVEGIDVEIGEQPDFREDLGAQEVGPVDEQDGMDVGGVGDGEDVLLDVTEHGGAAIVGLQAEQDRQVGVELDGAVRRKNGTGRRRGRGRRADGARGGATGNSCRCRACR